MGTVGVFFTMLTTLQSFLTTHSLFIALVALMVFDYLTGTITAFVTQSPNSRANMIGVAKKTLIIVLLVAVAVIERVALGLPEIPQLPYTRIATIGFLAAEFWSIIENTRRAGILPPYLSALFDILTANLRKAGGEKER